MTALLDEHPHLGVEPVLRELHIASSTYYRWRRAEQEPCERRRRDAELTGARPMPLNEAAPGALSHVKSRVTHMAQSAPVSKGPDRLCAAVAAGRGFHSATTDAAPLGCAGLAVGSAIAGTTVRT